MAQRILSPVIGREAPTEESPTDASLGILHFKSPPTNQDSELSSPSETEREVPSPHANTSSSEQLTHLRRLRIAGSEGSADDDGKRLKGERVHTRTEKALFLKLEVAGRKTVSALLDTGATADFIDSRLVAELNVTKYALANEGCIRLASEGLTVPVESEVTLDITCNGVRTRRGFFVYPQLTESIVLGTPFAIDFAKELNLSTQEFNGLPLDVKRPQTLAGCQASPIVCINATRLERHCKSRDNMVFTLL
ncbi:hypothetical protein OXX59_009730, partial [Metschnikowia pulcherrima]